MRRFSIGLMVVLLLLGGWNIMPVSAYAEEKGTEPDTAIPAAAVDSVGNYAQSAALIDVKSGRIIYSKQGDKSLPIASLTKIMTAIVAIEKGKLTDPVRVSKNAFGKEGSSIYLKLGETISLADLLYGLMLRSGNDAATAIAEHVGGSLEGFVYLMNAKAEEIGMDNSHFTNPHGLDDKEHYASANDMAKLAAYALRNPVFQEIVKTRSKKVTREDQPWDSVWTNKNKMLVLYPGSDGVKTGFTKIARRCLVSSATRDNQQLVAVTLNDGNDWADHARMLDYGFAHYPLRQVVEKGQLVEDGAVAKSSFVYPATDAEAKLFTRQIQLTAPGSVADRLGEKGRIKLYLDDRQIGSVSLDRLPDNPGAKPTGGAAFKDVALSTQTSFGERFTASLLRVARMLIGAP